MQQEWPTSVGHLDFNSSEVVSFYAGPQSITQEAYLGKTRHEETGLKLDPNKGNTIEFWFKKDTTSANQETVFEIGTHPNVAYQDTDNNRVRLRLYFDKNQGNSSCLKFTYTSASGAPGSVTQIGPQDITIGNNSTSLSSVVDSSWHHYAIKISQAQTGTTLGVPIYGLFIKLYVDGEVNSTTLHSLSIAQIGQPTMQWPVR